MPFPAGKERSSPSPEGFTPEPRNQSRMVLAQPVDLDRDASDPSSRPVLSGPDSTCSLDTIQQEMERLPMGKRRLAVQLRMALDSQWIWAVLTDYDNLHRFIPNLASSRQIWRRSNRVAVEQVGTQQFCGLRFSARVTLELEEDRPQGRLNFRMLDGDFRCFSGAWVVGSDATSSWLLYDLTVQGKPGMPIGLIEQRLQEDLANNLRGVQQEAQRRALRL